MRILGDDAYLESVLGALKELCRQRLGADGDEVAA
jgi:hypothetical protein